MLSKDNMYYIENKVDKIESLFACNKNLRPNSTMELLNSKHYHLPIIVALAYFIAFALFNSTNGISAMGIVLMALGLVWRYFAKDYYKIDKKIVQMYPRDTVPSSRQNLWLREELRINITELEMAFPKEREVQEYCENLRKEMDKIAQEKSNYEQSFRKPIIIIYSVLSVLLAAAIAIRVIYLK